LVFEEAVKMLIWTRRGSISDVQRLNLRKAIFVTVQIKVSKNLKLFVINNSSHGLPHQFSIGYFIFGVNHLLD
jgi:hypothetical protein